MHGLARVHVDAAAVAAAACTAVDAGISADVDPLHGDVDRTARAGAASLAEDHAEIVHDEVVRGKGDRAAGAARRRNDETALVGIDGPEVPPGDAHLPGCLDDDVACGALAECAGRDARAVQQGHI